MATVTTASPVAVASQRNRIMRRFKEAGATAPERSIDPATHQIHQTFVFNKLVREGVLVKVRSHQYYLNEIRAAQYKEQRFQSLLLFLIILTIAFAVYLFLQWL
jgi:hypothetical protein